MIDETTPPPAAPPAETEVAALTRQLGERDHAFGALKAELEQAKADAEASSARTAAESAASITAAVADAAAKYQALIVQTNPEIPAELIVGNTIAELAASLARGKSIVQKVKTNLDAQTQAAPVPAGAPARQGVDLSSLSAHEKIIEGIRQRDSK